MSLEEGQAAYPQNPLGKIWKPKEGTDIKPSLLSPTILTKSSGSPNSLGVPEAQQETKNKDGSTRTEEALVAPAVRVDGQRLDVLLPRGGGDSQRAEGEVPVLRRAPV